MIRTLALAALLAGCSTLPSGISTGSAPIDQNQDSRPRCRLRWPDGLHAEARCMPLHRSPIIMTATEKPAAAPQLPKDPIQPRCFEPYTLGNRDGFLMCNFYEYIVRTA